MILRRDSCPFGENAQLFCICMSTEQGSWKPQGQSATCTHDGESEKKQHILHELSAVPNICSYHLHCPEAQHLGRKERELSDCDLSALLRHLRVNTNTDFQDGTAAPSSLFPCSVLGSLSKMLLPFPPHQSNLSPIHSHHSWLLEPSVQLWRPLHSET